MGPIPAILSGVMTIFYYGMVIAAVWKLFQVATDLGEIKTILAEMQRSRMPTAAAKPPALAGPISLESAEALLREVEAESHALAAAERPKTTA